MEKIKTDCEWRTWKNWPIFSRCAICDVAPLKGNIWMCIFMATNCFNGFVRNTHMSDLRGERDTLYGQATWSSGRYPVYEIAEPYLNIISLDFRYVATSCRSCIMRCAPISVTTTFQGLKLVCVLFQMFTVASYIFILWQPQLRYTFSK